MKQERVKLQQLKNDLVGLEMELDLIERDSFIVDQNLDYLRKIEADYLFNLNFLKKEKVISIASEYKKIKGELEVARVNISHYENKKKALEMKGEHNRNRYNKYLEELKELEIYMENRKIVLLFDLKRRRKKKKR